MQIFKSSFNLSLELSWEMICDSIIRAWIRSTKNLGQNRMDHLLSKWPSFNFQKPFKIRWMACGDAISFNYFKLNGVEYLSVCLENKARFAQIGTHIFIDFKKTLSEFSFSLALETKTSNLQNIKDIKTPQIFERLLERFFEFQLQNVPFKLSRNPIFLEADEINKACSIVESSITSSLPIVYISCNEKNHQLRPSAVAAALMGLAHVIVEKESFAEQLVKMTQRSFPKNGEVGLFLGNGYLEILSRNSKTSWVNNPKEMVNDIYKRIIRNHLNSKTFYNHKVFEQEYAQYLLFELGEKRKKCLKIVETQKENITDLTNQIAKLKNQETELRTQNDKNVANLNKTINDLKKDRDRCMNEAISLEDEREKYKKESEKNAKFKQLYENLKLEVNKENIKNGITFNMPTNSKYDKEFVYLLLAGLECLKSNAPKSKTTSRFRVEDAVDEFFDANKMAVKQYNNFRADLEKIRILAEKSELHKSGDKLLRPFNIFINKCENGHYVIRYTNDDRYSASESCTASDKRHGGKNQWRDLKNSLFF